MDSGLHDVINIQLLFKIRWKISFWTQIISHKIYDIDFDMNCAHYLELVQILRSYSSSSVTLCLRNIVFLSKENFNCTFQIFICSIGS